MADAASRDTARQYILKTLAFAKTIPRATTIDDIKGKREALEKMWTRFEKFHSSIMSRTGPAEIEVQESGYDDCLEAYCSANALLEAYIKQVEYLQKFMITFDVLRKHILLANEANNSEESIIKVELDTAQTLFETLRTQFDSCISAGLTYLQEKFSEIQTEFIVSVALWESATKRFIKIPQSNELPNGAPISRFLEFQVKPIPLPIFTGKTDNWETFRDMFKKGFHERPDMSNVVKFQHLKASLGGEAEMIIRNIPLSEDNYASAWALLLRHYDNISGLVKTHLRNIFSQAKCKSNSSDISHMLATTVSSVQALKNLGCPTQHWDDILVFVVTERLDNESCKLWEQLQSTRDERPTWVSLENFLYSRVRALTSIGQTQPIVPFHSQKFSKSNIQTHQVATNNQANNNVCVDCNKGHRINFCVKFRRRAIEDRIQLVEQKGLCFNCLGSNHKVDECPSEKRCIKCNESHNSLLHINEYTPSTAHNIISAHVPVHHSSPKNHILLSTARVRIYAAGRSIVLRALLDQGSQSSFITETVVNLLNLKRKKVNVCVTGIGSLKIGNASGLVDLDLGPLSAQSATLSVKALVLRKITTQPKVDISVTSFKHLHGLQLADPSCEGGEHIDLLLGADVYGTLLMEGLRKGPPGTPTAQQTTLGWIISGPVETTSQSTKIHCGLVIDQQLQRFWEMEEISTTRTLNKDEQLCEDLFAKTYRRNDTGRFIVRLPLCATTPSLGESYKSAATQMYGLERRFKKNPRFHEQYQEFINQYISLGHMERVNYLAPEQNPKRTYYIPHHAIIKESSTTTKLRVVFDASRKTSNGSSLNEQMFAGPRLQQELFSIILRWRKHEVVFTTDIEKMFRQIIVDERDRDLQRILWRPSEQEALQKYRLTTVTYGTTSAPYLAIKCIRQLAENERTKFPLGSKAVLQDTYVDDILTGSTDIHSCLEIQRQLISLLNSGGFVLKKWSSNKEELLNHLPPDYRESKLPLSINIDDSIKTLGIMWNPSLDVFTFSVCISDPPQVVTKRNLLSDASKLYDPLGWLAPSIVLAKLMFQHLWTLNLGWDDPLPPKLTEDWLSFRQGLVGLRNVQIPRWILTAATSKNIQIHGFCDASMKAYAAVVYIRIIDSNGKISTSILASKTKVAPLKTLSLPKLELCGALLLSRLLETVISSMDFPSFQIFAWSDSEIVLAWLKSSPNRWTIFVANRISEIQNASNTAKWNHVDSKENPADLGSRGVHPTILHEDSLWWQGPHWLRNIDFPYQKDINDTNEEEKLHSVNALIVTNGTSTIFSTYFNNCSDWNRLLRIHAYVLRFVSNSRKPFAERNSSYPSTGELELSRNSICRASQLEDFPKEIPIAKAGHSVKGKLSSLNPFVDANGILRVGGRLKNSELSYGEKHPIIISNKSLLATLIIRHAHEVTLHSGAQSTLAFIRRIYWIIDGRNAVQHFIQKCVRCIRYRPQFQHQLMGDLPACRVTPARPFLHTGVDFSGAIQVRSARGRGHHATKAYVALFVCMATRAIHLELVSDLTSAAFIAAFKRFTSRRGICSHLYSDNATNFIGAYVELKRQLSKSTRLSTIAKDLLECGTTWHFSPPTSPHFNGISEAGIRSIKHHLKRVIGEATMTFEELYTLLTQIEACLNSRPVHALSNDPDDPTPLTPGHFLIGGPLNAVPEASLEDINVNRLTRWQLVQQRVQHFWKRWSTEYIHHLQQRQKWRSSQPDVQVGNVVLLKEDNLPPGKWSLGIVTETHPGPDGRVRVVTIRSKNSTFKRSVVKLILLPINTVN